MEGDSAAPVGQRDRGPERGNGSSRPHGARRRRRRSLALPRPAVECPQSAGCHRACRSVFLRKTCTLSAIAGPDARLVHSFAEETEDAQKSNRYAEPAQVARLSRPAAQEASVTSASSLASRARLDKDTVTADNRRARAFEAVRCIRLPSGLVQRSVTVPRHTRGLDCSSPTIELHGKTQRGAPLVAASA